MSDKTNTTPGMLPNKESDSPEPTISRFKKKLVSDAIKKTNCCKMNVLMDEIVETLCDRYPDERIDYELSRLGLQTTADIKALIELYFSLYPAEYFRK